MTREERSRDLARRADLLTGTVHSEPETTVRESEMTATKERRQEGRTVYSDVFVGDKQNHNQEVRADVTDGYVGLTQGKDRVLLTPEQWQKIARFIRSVR